MLCFVIVGIYSNKHLDLDAFEGVDRDSVELNQLMAQNTFMEVALANPEVLLPPGKHLAAQLLTLQHVKTIRNVVQKTGTTPTHGIGICINTKLHKLWKDGFTVTLTDLIQAGIEMHAGNHTRVGLVGLKSDFPKNPLFQVQQFKAILLPATAEVFHAVRTVGALQNVKARASKDQKWYDVTFTMYENLAAIKKMYHPKPVPKDEIRRMKSSWAVGHSLPAASISTYFQLANLPDDFFSKIRTVITGDGIPESMKFKRWTSSNTFNQMSLSGEMIPHHTLKGWLDDAIMGNLSAASFQKRCLMYKCADRLKMEILDFIDTCYFKHETLENPMANMNFERSWEWMEKNINRLTTEEFLYTYVKLCWDRPVRDGFLPSLRDDVIDAFEQFTRKLPDEKIEV